MRKSRVWTVLLSLGVFFCATFGALFPAAGQESLWPEVSGACRPGAYWWWMGSAVDRESLTRNIQQAAENGMGLLNIIPIYGVQGNEKNDLAYMSPEWLAMLDHAVGEGERLGVEIHMTLGTGWCFGGPAVLPEDSVTAKKIVRDADGRFRVEPARNLIDVKRSAPGGEGPMLDPYSVRAMTRYLEWFDAKWRDYRGKMPAAVYHDSFEYYGADWSDALYERFEQLNGYRLDERLDALLADDKDADGNAVAVDESAEAVEHRRRIRADYRRTLAQMHFDYIETWVDWAHKRGMLTRNEAHGSPSNLIDVYALADMPEPECFNKDKEILMTKFSSSAAHLACRRWVTSEMGTWLAEHFHEKPAALKVIADGMLLGGVNRAVFHGNVYSPNDAAWPGWCFYASTELNPRNSLWETFGALNRYLARAQSFLQAGTVENDALLYWSPEDVWHDAGGAGPVCFTVHNTGDWLRDTPSELLGKRLWARGITFDYVSDRWLKNLTVRDGKIYSGKNCWKALVVPKLPLMDVESLRTIRSLAQSGATVLFDSAVPADVPGFGRLAERREEADAIRPAFDALVTDDAAGELARRLYGDSAGRLGDGDVPKFIARRLDDGYVFFVSNIPADMSYDSDRPIAGTDAFYRLPVDVREVALLDPMTGAAGRAEWNRDGDNDGGAFPNVRLQLGPNRSILIRTFDEKPATPLADWSYFDSSDPPRIVPIDGAWRVDFLCGGPTLPAPLTLETLRSWTEFGTDYENFAGTARYGLTFDLPNLAQIAGEKGEKSVRLSLGTVEEAAVITLNGHELGCRFQPPIAAEFPAEWLKESGNTLQIDVTNLSANRIRHLDREGIPWKVAKDINIVSPNYQPLNAKDWPILPAGLLGPVTLEFGR